MTFVRATHGNASTQPQAVAIVAAREPQPIVNGHNTSAARVGLKRPTSEGLQAGLAVPQGGRNAMRRVVNALQPVTGTIGGLAKKVLPARSEAPAATQPGFFTRLGNSVSHAIKSAFSFLSRSAAYVANRSKAILAPIPRQLSAAGSSVSNFFQKKA